MRPRSAPDYLAGYPAELSAQVRLLIEQDRLGAVLRTRYPQVHAIRTDKALYDYAQALKTAYLRNAGPLNLVAYDSNLQLLTQALGMHTRVARVQGHKLKAKREIRVASLFREAPPEFLRMIVVHELAHLKEREHGKAFYQLCQHMEPDYHQFEFDLRAYLCHLDARGEALWSAVADGTDGLHEPGGQPG